MGYCERASDARADHSFASRTFASVTCNSLKSSPTPGRSLRQTGKPGVGVWRTGLTGLRWRPGPRRLSRGGRERNVKDQIKRPPITSVPAATKIATQESGFWATQEPTNTDALTIASPRRGCLFFKNNKVRQSKVVNGNFEWCCYFLELVGSEVITRCRE